MSQKKKYWVYSALWRSRGESGGFHEYMTGLHVGSITSLYEKIIKQPEYICLTSVTKIDAEEYLEAKENGIIG